MKTLFFAVLVSAAVSAESGPVGPKSTIEEIPVGTTVALKADTFLRPRTVYQDLAWYQDEDADGAPDCEDWCPKTPAGKKVWLRHETYEQKKPVTWSGCSSESEVDWIYDPKDLSKAPKGQILKCQIRFDASEKERVIRAGKTFEVFEVKEAVKPERNWWFQGGPTLSLKTAGGASLNATCFLRQGRTWANEAQYQYLYEKSLLPWSQPATVEEMGHFFTFKFPAPEEIP